MFGRTGADGLWTGDVRATLLIEASLETVRWRVCNVSDGGWRWGRFGVREEGEKRCSVVMEEGE